jgi:outer membrane protein assembly factor BamB
MNKTLTATICCLTILLTAIILPITEPTIAQQNNPTYKGDVGYTDLVTAKNGIKFSINNESTIYSDQPNFSIKFSAYQNTPDNMMSLGAFLYNITYSTSWVNETVSAYQWSINDPANLEDDDPNPQLTFEKTLSLAGVPQGEQQIHVSCCGGGYVLITQDDGTVYETFAKSSTATLTFTISGATPATAQPTPNNQQGLLWETSIQWNLTGTPAENYWDTDIYSKTRTWTTPIIEEDILYAAAKSTVTLNTYGNPTISWMNVYAFNVANGAKIWSYQGNYSINQFTELAVSGGAVFFGAGDYVTALNASNGNIIWRLACATGNSSPEVAQGKVFVGSGNSVIALDSLEGGILWNYTTNGVVAASPVVSNGVVYVGSNDANLYALNTEDGKEIWSFKAGDGFVGKPAISHGTVYTGSSDGYMYALRASDGSKVWSYDTNPPKVTAPTDIDQTFNPSSPVSTDGLLYFISSGTPYDAASQNYKEAYGMVYAFSTSSGQLIWSTKINDKCGEPVLSDGLIYVNVLSAEIVALKANNGENVLTYSGAETSPAVSNGAVYFASGGQIVAVKTPEGDFISLPTNIEYSINYPMFGLMSGIVIALTVLILYSFKKPFNLKLSQKIKLPTIKKNLFKKKEDTPKEN